jgi:hypothetical protein
MSLSSQRLNKAVVELVARARQSLGLPPAPPIPAAMADRARVVPASQGS